MIKFQLLATKVGNTIKTVGTYWILNSIQWQGYWGTARHSTWPRSPYRGLLPSSPATQSRTRSLLNSSKQDYPAVVISNRTTKPKIKGPLDRDKSCSQVGATHEALLHLPCFSHSRLVRLEAPITFIGHIT